MMASNQYFVYILLCNNGAYYTGYTSHLQRRFEEHIRGSTKCKFTRSFKPLRIEQSWIINDTKKMAMSIERFIKKLSREEKTQLILNPTYLEKIFPNVLCSPNRITC